MFSREEAENCLADLEPPRPRGYYEGQSRLVNLELRLRETALWCERHVDLTRVQACLRPWSVAPRLLSRHRQYLVDDVAGQRRVELHQTRSVSRMPPGELLVYFPDMELSDGAAKAESRGFFDVYSAPPWGAWVAYFEDRRQDDSPESHLLAWVPEELVPLATVGIEADPSQCIQWLDESSARVRSVLDFMAMHGAWWE